MTDTDRLNWLENFANGCGVFSDDNWGGKERWAFGGSGFQPVVEDSPISGEWIFWVDEKDWKPTLREAIDAAIEELEKNPPMKEEEKIATREDK